MGLSRSNEPPAHTSDPLPFGAATFEVLIPVAFWLATTAVFAPQNFQTIGQLC
jgi:hypothetical protein